MGAIVTIPLSIYNQYSTYINGGIFLYSNGKNYFKSKKKSKLIRSRIIIETTKIIKFYIPEIIKIKKY